MAKPLISNDPNPPKDTRFSHFGVLETGKSSKGAAVTSITINIVIILLMVIIGAVVKTSPEMQKKLIALTLQPKPPEPKPIPPKPIPPPPKPLPVPKVVLEPPKIKLTPVPEKVPDIKPLPVPVPKPVVLNTPAPLKVNPPPAPKVVNLSAPAKAASIANNDAHPSPVRMGNPEIKALNGPAVATPVNLGGGMHNMNPSNTGSGPRALSANLGNGSPAGTDIHGRAVAVAPIKGISTGVPGGTGIGTNGPRQVQVQVAQVAAVTPQVIRTATLAKPPVITYQPKAQYTPEAMSLHLAGEITVSIVLHANGTVQAIGVVGPGLGHGLNESAITVAQGLRFKPALDSNGQPVDFPTKIIVRFVSNS